MADLTISTTDPTYKKNKSDLEALLVYLKTVIPYFMGASFSEKKEWLSKDPLLKLFFSVTKEIIKNYPDIEKLEI